MLIKKRYTSSLRVYVCCWMNGLQNVIQIVKYSSAVREYNLDTCDNMDGNRGHFAK